MPAKPPTGTQICEALMELAQRLGFMTHHETDSRKTAAGWPDLIICGHGFILAIECKSRGEKLIDTRIVGRGRKQRVMPGQLDWLRNLAAANVPTFICRPDEPEVRSTSTTEPAEIGYERMTEIILQIHGQSLLT